MRILLTSFGFDDPGGGTAVPREVSKELASRGHEVLVFYAAVEPHPSGLPYALSDRVQEGVRLVGIHNRPSVLFDNTAPEREIDDPAIRAAFSGTLDSFLPDVVHFHNLHNLGASLMDEVSVRGIRSYFTTHNYWLVCPRAYLMTAGGDICPGPGDGGACASCNGAPHRALDYQRRLGEIRARASGNLTRILAVSDAVRKTLAGAGYPAEMIDVVRQAMPRDQRIWESVGRRRVPGRLAEELTVGFIGSAYPHKGPQLLVQAAQQTRARLRVRICGEIPARFAQHLREIDRRGVLELTGPFGSDQLPELLREIDVAALPSTWWDCAPLAAAEALAARVPLIVPRLGGMPEAVREGVDGLTFDALDVDDLTRQLDRLTDEPELLPRLQAAIEPPAGFAAYVDTLERYYAGDAAGTAARAPATPPTVGAAEPFLAACTASVRWKGDHGRASSLSIINDRVTERLAGPVQRIDREGRAVDGPLAHGADVEVRHQWPPDLSPPPSGALAVILPWEFGAVPEQWLGQIDAGVDELWVPSEYARRMYLQAGVDSSRVHVIPNGVDLGLFSPDGPARSRSDDGQGTRFLFVGGLTSRKGPDLLYRAYCDAFTGRDDVTLVIKDFGKDAEYRGSDRSWLYEHIGQEALPRIELIDAELTPEELAALYRSCDVLVHPYRGEAFAMPVLEAMACGLAVIVTAGGPTDEFCPDTACWRIRSRVVTAQTEAVDHLTTRGRPWMLEPGLTHLMGLLREVAGEPRELLRARGACGRAAALDYGWDIIAGQYGSRVDALRSAPLRRATHDDRSFPFSAGTNLRVLARPAWRGEHHLTGLLAAWSRATCPQTSACLYLLADTTSAGSAEELTDAILAAAELSGVDLDDCADVEVLCEPVTDARDVVLTRSVDVYVPCGSDDAYTRIARRAGCQIATAGELAHLTASLSCSTPPSANGSQPSALSNS